MSTFLGFDTSNYTTSCALFKDGEMLQSKKLLPVKDGGRGLRQSDAVFHHTQQLPQVLEGLADHFTGGLTAVGVSDCPRTEPGSYMPCFTVGICTAKALSGVLRVPLYRFSHQQGHIAAALYSVKRLDLVRSPFLAFHVSGGTTEALLVTPDDRHIFTTRIAAKTLDLNAGQVIDRVGVMLGLSFPCGKELEGLALACTDKIKGKPSLKGCDCCLSGVENQCRRLWESGAPKEYVAAYCLTCVSSTLSLMTQRLLLEYGTLPLLYAGGVMSNTMIRGTFQERFGGLFAQPEYSCDNAAGIAVLTSAMHEKETV